MIQTSLHENFVYEKLEFKNFDYKIINEIFYESIYNLKYLEPILIAKLTYSQS